MRGGLGARRVAGGARRGGAARQAGDAWQGRREEDRLGCCGTVEEAGEGRGAARGGKRSRDL